jgi:hypothetical protein
MPVKSMFRPPEYEDLRVIAEGWRVPIATAVWAIVVSQLGRWRREAPELGENGLVIAAGVAVLRMRSAPVHDGAPREDLEEGA